MSEALRNADVAFKVNNFDIIRVVAALQVLLFHTAHHLQITLPAWVAPLEYFHGVPIFFATSGYLISASYERRADLKSYFRNRFLRIYPALWCVILCTVAVVLAIGAFNFWQPSALVWALSQAIGMIYTPGFLKEFGFGSYNGSLWTIPIELQFYFLLPLLYWVCGKNKHFNNSSFNPILWAVWAVAVILAIVWLQRALGQQENIGGKLFRYSFLPHLYIFITGIFMQRLQLYRSSLIRGKAIIWLGGYLAVAMLLPENPVFIVAKNLLLALASLAVAYSLPTASRTLLKGNDISYGIYIYHGLIINVFVEFNRLHSHFYLLGVTIITLLCSYTSWMIVERPFLRLKTSS